MTTIQQAPDRRRSEETRPGQGDVVVGVDGSTSAQAAVDYALVEATAGYRPVRLVAILDGHGLPLQRHLDTEEDKQTWDELRRLTQTARHRYPRTEVHQELHVGDPVEQLVALAEGQHLLVVGKRGLGTFSRMVVGSTSTAVAGRAGVPVIVVPDGWVRPDHAGAPIVVGVDVDQDNGQLLRFAFQQASRRQSTLVVVHAIDDRPHLMWDVEAEALEFRSFVDRQVRSVDEMVAEVRTEFPLVPCHVAQTVQSAPDALLDAAAEAQLLVVGRHATGRFGLPIGSVTRNVLHYAELPVAVVPCR